MYRFFSYILTVGIILILVGSAAGNIHLTPIDGFAIPGIQTISEYHFGNFDSDAVPELLVRSGTKLVLYSISGDSLLYDITLPAASQYKTAMGDVNRDGQCEIIVAMSFAMSECEESDSAAVIELYTVENSSPVERVYFNNYDFTADGCDVSGPSESFELEALSTEDIDGDGYPNLLFSYRGQLLFANCSDTYGEYFGHIIIYDAFPVDTLVHTNDYFNAPIFLNTGCNPIIIGTRDQSGQKYGMPFEEYSWWTRSIVLFSYEDNAFYNIGFYNGGGGCYPFDYPTISNMFDLLLCANINPETCEYEMLVNYDYGTSCFNDEPGGGSYSTGRGEENYYGPLISESSYSTEEPLPPRKDTLYAFHPYYPGTYFALDDSLFWQFNAANSQAMENVGAKPAGQLNWVAPYGNNIPYLAAVIGNTFTLYGLSYPTPVDDQPAAVPGLFSLGPARPNPFNASQTIPVHSLRTGEPLSVAVYNILGERVMTLYDGSPTQTEMDLVWNASEFSSGIYFIMARSGTSMAVIKSVLLK